MEEKKKLTTGQIGIICGLAVIAVLLVVLIAVMVKNAPGKQAEATEPSESAETAQTADEAEAAETAEQTQTAEGLTQEDVDLPEGVVLQCGDSQIDSLMFNYYYWDTYFGVLGSYGDSITMYFDPSVPLDQQIYDESSGQTWDETFRSMAVSSAVQVLAFQQVAEKEGFTLPESYAQDLTDLVEEYRQLALDQGYDTLDAYLQDTYGPEAGEESFTAYQTAYLTATAYTDMLYYQPEYTDEELSEYFDTYAEEYEELGVTKDDSPMVDLRHIMVCPEDAESEESWAEAETRINEIYDQWKTDATQEHFAALAEEYSQDASSVGSGGDWTEVYNGGLYENVYNGSMDEAFSEWLFADDRAAGDTTLIKTDSAWHILYFVDQKDQSFWQYTADLDMRYEAYQAASDQLLADYAYAYDGNHLTLHTPVGLYDNAETAEAEAAASAE